MTRFRFNAPANHVLQVGDRTIAGGEEFDHDGQLLHPDVETLGVEVSQTPQEPAGDAPEPETTETPSEEPEVVNEPEKPSQSFTPKVRRS